MAAPVADGAAAAVAVLEPVLVAVGVPVADGVVDAMGNAGSVTDGTGSANSVTDGTGNVGSAANGVAVRSSSASGVTVCLWSASGVTVCLSSLAAARARAFVPTNNDESAMNVAPCPWSRSAAVAAGGATAEFARA